MDDKTRGIKDPLSLCYIVSIASIRSAKSLNLTELYEPIKLIQKNTKPSEKNCITGRFDDYRKISNDVFAYVNEFKSGVRIKFESGEEFDSKVYKASYY